MSCQSAFFFLSLFRFSCCKELTSRNLVHAAEALKWPTKVDYPSIPPVQRRAFERAYQDLLYLQAEYVQIYLV